MTKPTIIHIFYLVSIFGLSSCGIYRQNVVNTPLMQQKGQAQISGSVGVTGYDGQLAYAPTKKIAIIANYSDLGTEQINYSSENYTINKHNFYEMGIGCYKKNKSALTSEYFLIAGKGATSRYNQGLDSNMKISSTFQKVTYNRFCFQADYGKTIRKWEYIVSPRIMVVNYYNISDNSSESYKDLPATYLYADITGSVRYNFLKYFKLSGQLNLTIPATDLKPSYYEFSPFNCSLGLIINMNFYKAIQTN
jgi:hypothetical protein